MRIISIIVLALVLNSCAGFKDFFQRERNLAALNRQKFTVNTRSPNVEVSNIEAQFNRSFPLMGIAKHDIKVEYFPFEDAVCLQYRINGYTYSQFWHKEGREDFVKALGKYKEEYSEQKLKNRNSKTRTQYGIIKNSYLSWQSFSKGMVATGNMEMELGYYFKDGSPYFAVTQLEAFYESPNLEKDDNGLSPEIPIYFTRAQADELAAVFNQDYLASITPEEYLGILGSSRRPESFPPELEDY